MKLRFLLQPSCSLSVVFNIPRWYGFTGFYFCYYFRLFFHCDLKTMVTILFQLPGVSNFFVANYKISFCKYLHRPLKEGVFSAFWIREFNNRTARSKLSIQFL